MSAADTSAVERVHLMCICRFHGKYMRYPCPAWIAWTTDSVFEKWKGRNCGTSDMTVYIASRYSCNTICCFTFKTSQMSCVQTQTRRLDWDLSTLSVSLLYPDVLMSHCTGFTPKLMWSMPAQVMSRDNWKFRVPHWHRNGRVTMSRTRPNSKKTKTYEVLADRGPCDGTAI